MKFVHVLAAGLIVVGVLNWGVVSLFRFDLVPAALGDATLPSRIACVVVGVAGVFRVLQWKAVAQRA